MAALHKWLCTQNCFFGGARFRKNQVILAATNPNELFFVLMTNDDAVRPAPQPMLDHDNTYYYGVKGWEDFRFPVSSTRQGALNKPDYDYTDNGYLFPQNDTDEVLYASDQFPHSMFIGQGSIGIPHLHLIQAADAQAVFKLKYRIIANGQAVSEWSTLTSAGYVFPYSSGSIAQKLLFPQINLHNVGTSSMVDVQLWRDDNAYTGDILVKSIDIHIPLDSFGSGQEYFK